MAFDVSFNMEFVLRDLCRPSYKKPTPNKKGEVEIFCPIHGDKDFEVNIQKEHWNCFKKCSDCPCNGAGGILDLYVLFHGGNRKKAYAKIMSTIEGKEDKRQLAQKRIAEAPAVVRQAEKKVCPEKLDSAYSALLNMLPLAQFHRESLLSRGLTDSAIESVGFRSIPQLGIKIIPQILVKSGHNLDGVPGFYKENGVWKMASHGSGFFIPHRDVEGRIVGLQIRYDICITDDMDEREKKKLKQMRYRWFTSSGEENGASASNVPFWGIPGTEKQKGVVYVTEGGLKAATAQALSGRRFVSIPGVTCFVAFEQLLNELKEQGVTTLVDAFDSDRATNPCVENAVKKLHELSHLHGLEMKPWDWGVEYKGVDDYLLARKKTKCK